MKWTCPYEKIISQKFQDPNTYRILAEIATVALRVEIDDIAVFGVF